MDKRQGQKTGDRVQKEGFLDGKGIAQKIYKIGDSEKDREDRKRGMRNENRGQETG